MRFFVLSNANKKNLILSIIPSITVCSQIKVALLRLQFVKQDRLPPAAQSCFEIALCELPGVAL